MRLPAYKTRAAEKAREKDSTSVASVFFFSFFNTVCFYKMLLFDSWFMVSVCSLSRGGTREVAKHERIARVSLSGKFVM